MLAIRQLHNATAETYVVFRGIPHHKLFEILATKKAIKTLVQLIISPCRYIMPFLIEASFHVHLTISALPTATALPDSYL